MAHVAPWEPRSSNQKGWKAVVQLQKSVGEERRWRDWKGGGGHFGWRCGLWPGVREPLASAAWSKQQRAGPSTTTPAHPLTTHRTGGRQTWQPGPANVGLSQGLAKAKMRAQVHQKGSTFAIGLPRLCGTLFYFPLHSFFSMDTKGRERAALPEYKLYPTWTWQTQMLHLGSSPRPTDQTIEPEMFAASDQYDGRVAPTTSFESRRSDGTSPYTVPHPAQVDIRSPSTFVGI